MPAGGRQAAGTDGRSGTGPAVEQQSSGATIRESNPPVNTPIGRNHEPGRHEPGRVDEPARSC
jgi:hypothetical protein